MSKIKISVVIPTYNGCDYIMEAINSILSQTLPPAEIIIVDDASTDGTPDLVERIARSSPIPIRLIRLEQNSGGPARPMNVGIEAAKGEFIAICDQDDLFLPEKLDQQATLLESNSELSFVFSLVGDESDTGRILQHEQIQREIFGKCQQSVPYRVLGGTEVLKLLLKFGNFVYGYPGFMFRRKCWIKRKGLDESFKIASDYEFLCWLCGQGSVAGIPRILYLRREHANNLTKAMITTSLEVYFVRARFLAGTQHLFDTETHHRLRDEMYGLAYYVRESGRYYDALICHSLWIKIWGPSPKVIREVIKLGPHWIRRRYFGLWQSMTRRFVNANSKNSYPSSK